MQNPQKAARPIPYFGLVPGQTLSCKTFQLSYTDEARWLFPPDPLLLIPRLEWTCHGTERLVARRLPIFGGPTFTRSYYFRPNGQRRTPLFLRADPVFLSPFASGHRLPHLRTGRARIRAILLRRTHFCSFRLIDEGVPAAPQFFSTGMVTGPSAQGGSGTPEALQRGGLALLSVRPTS